MLITRNQRSAVLAVALAVLWAAPAGAVLLPQNVLLLYNSQNAESLAVRNAYLAAHPGVVQFDLNDATLLQSGVGRGDYLTRVRDPLKNFINGVSTGTDLSLQIMAIATTRGLPAVLLGNSELSNVSAWASFESELTLLQQDLEAGPNPGTLPFRFNGMVDNPYHRVANTSISTFSRASVKTQRTFTNTESTPPGFQTWLASGLTSGDIYLVCRLDSAPGPGPTTSVQNIQALINRSLTLTVTPCQTQVLLDEDTVGNLDAGSLPPRYSAVDDFTVTRTSLTPLGFTVTQDLTNNFITGPELSNQTKPLIVLGTYGENHDLNGGENPPGAGTYLTTYNLHPASMLMSIESWNGNSLIDGLQRDDHAQSLDFIALGGSFTICNVKEPFSFTVADLKDLTTNMMQFGLTYAEAAYSSIPAISWQQTPVGDPLARITVVNPPLTDFNCDFLTTLDDLYLFNAAPRDVNGDLVLNGDDQVFERNAVRGNETAQISVR